MTGVEKQAYQQGWEAACTAALQQAMQISGYPYGPDNPCPDRDGLLLRLGEITGVIARLRQEAAARALEWFFASEKSGR